MMTTPLKLYELADVYESVVADIIEAEGELTPELEERLTAINDSIIQKMESIGLYCRNLRATAEAQMNESRRLSAMAKTTVNTLESLKEYAKAQLERAGMDKVKTDKISVAIRKSPMSVTWEADVRDLPDEYQIVSVRVDNAKAKSDYKAGKQIPDGFKVVDDKTHLRVA